jgi:tRNA (mo5U34)-methyltransferase
LQRLGLAKPPEERDPLAERAAADYRRLVQAFRQRTEALGLAGEVAQFLWYHTIELPDGLVTPGAYDYRGVLPQFGFPADMSGQRVLDVGSATGFFAFEFERRGASVTSVELPSMAALDIFPGETPAQIVAKQERVWRDYVELTEAQRVAFFGPGGLDRLLHCMVDGPFKFCHRLLRSRVERIYCRVYDIPTDRRFDTVFIGDVLLHTINPLQALAAAAAVCEGTLIVAQELPGAADAAPAMLYVGGDTPGFDYINWWMPNQRCLEQILRKLGFNDVRVAGHNVGYGRPGGIRFDRTVVHASR